MVLYGQSAGGGAVLSYLYSYPTDPIVTGFIAASAGTSAINPNDTNPAFSSVAQDVGCANLKAAAELACMQQVDAVKLRDAVVASGKGFRPIVDDVTQFVNLTERLEKGLVADRVILARAPLSLSSRLVITITLLLTKQRQPAPYRRLHL